MKIKLTLLLLLTCLCIQAQQMPSWIKKHAIPLNSGLNEKSGVQQYLKNERHILLGEPTHGDGTVMNYKVQLIKMLHEKHGFDVIMFEADMLKFYTAAKKGRVDAGSLVQAALPKMWGDAVEFKALIEYIDQQNSLGDSLFIAGFDTQLTQTSTGHLNTQLPVFLKANNISLSPDEGSNGLDEHRNFFSTLVLLIHKRFKNNSNLVSAVDLPRFENTLRALKEKADLIRSDEGNFWAQELGNIIDYLPLLYADNKLPHHFSTSESSLRDSIMANNFTYLVEKKFKGKKTVSWAATDHIRRGIPGEKAKKMGEFLKEKLDQPHYVIGFTAGEGYYYNYLDKNTYPIPPLDSNSFEYFARQTKKGDLFLDLKSNKIRHVKEGFTQKISMRPMGYHSITTNWTIPLDAIIYIDQAEASTMR